MTYAATANVIENCNAKTLFVDVNKNNGTINTDLIESKINKNTKAIIAVHYCGYPCDIDKIIKLGEKYRLAIIFDAAHCIEGYYKGKHISNYGDAACFSFYATKNITTGEGGTITTNNKDLYNFAKVYSMQGISSDAWNRKNDKENQYYDVILPGMKFNMMDLQAAIGIHQLNQIEKFYNIRLTQWKKYNEKLKDAGLILPILPVEKGFRHALHLYTILVDKKKCGLSRNELKTELEANGIGTGIHFISLHNHKYYKDKYNFNKNDFPIADYYSERTLSLPIGPALNESEHDFIIKTIKKIIGK